METFERMLARWRDAEARGDAAALDGLLGADFRGDGPCGFVLGKERWLDRHRSGDLTIEAFDWTPTEVWLGHRTAVAVGVQSQRARYRGRDWSGAFVCTLVAVRRDGRWTIVNVQVGHLADVSHGALHDAAGRHTTTEQEQHMATLIADMSMSLDGFIADPDDSTNDLFGWFFDGEEEVPTATPGVSFRTSQASASVLRDALGNVGALISGRRNFDLADGWGGNHPMGVPVIVVTHSVPDGWPREGGSMTFVTDGIESAVAQAKAAAGDKIVGVATPNIVQQCLDAGLLDGIHVNLVPVLLGKGIPFFANIATAPVQLEGPAVVEGTGVTHLSYRVRRT